MNLKEVFLKHCENNVFEINQRQLNIIDNLLDYYKDNFDQSFLNKILKKMILNQVSILWVMSV